MRKKITLPIMLIIIGVISLIVTFVFISRVIITTTVFSEMAGNNTINVNAPITKPVNNTTTNPLANEFKDGMTYMGTEGSDNIEIQDKNNNITEFDVKNPTEVYVLKQGNNKTGIGIQLNKYYNNQLVGHYNLLPSNGTWAGVYTTNNNDICSVSIK